MTLGESTFPWRRKPDPQRALRQRIEILWDLGNDTYEIAKRLGLDEFRVCSIVSAYVTAKKFRESAF